MRHMFAASLLEICRTRRFLVVAFLALLALFSLRLYNLDCDLPSWGVSQYTSLDEGTYAAMALNKYNYGVVNCEKLPIPSVTANAHRNNIIGNIATYCSLELFGDNYFGLRFPSFMWSLGTLLLMALILIRRLPDSSFRNMIIIVALAVPVLDFQYMIASRVVEPSVVRMFFVTLLVAILVVPRTSRLTLFAAGFVAVITIMLVYVTTAFIGLPLAILLYTLIKRKKYGEAISLVSGGMVAFVLGETYYRMVWQTSFWSNAIASVVGFSNLAAYEATSDLLSVFQNIKSILMNRCFVHCPFLLVLLTLSLPVVLLRFLRRQISGVHVIFSFVTAFFLQTLAVNDYVTRKFIVIYPLVVTGVAFSITEMISFWKNISDKRVYLVFAEGDTADITHGQWLRSGRGFVILAITVSLVLAFVAVHLCLYDVKPDKIDFNKAADRIAPSLFVLCPLVLAACLCICPNRRRILLASAFIAGGWMISSFFFAVKYVYANHNYVERDFMRKLGDELGSDRLWGEWAYSYTLYNDIKPVENDYASLLDGIKADGGGYLFNYEPVYADEHLVNEVTRQGYALKSHIRLRHSFYTLGQFRDHVVYRVKPFSGKRIKLSSIMESYIRELGYVLPQDKRGQCFLPKELCDFLDMRTE